MSDNDYILRIGIAGILLTFIGVWGGSWLAHNVSEHYEFAAKLTAMWVIGIGIACLATVFATAFD